MQMETAATAKQIDYRSGSCWITQVELAFHHVMANAADPGNIQLFAPFPSDAINIGIDIRSHCLLWLSDGSPAHAKWCSVDRMFKRVGDDAPISREEVRAWAALPYPVAQA